MNIAESKLNLTLSVSNLLEHPNTRCELEKRKSEMNYSIIQLTIFLRC